MSIVEALVLGAVQGLTEFLPVSSSGHLVLLQKLFGISGPVMLFDVMVHVGTLLAVFVVLRRDIGGILKKPLQPLTGYLLLATLPAVLVALVFKDAIEAAFTSTVFLGFAFLLTAAALALSDVLRKKWKGDDRGQESMNAVDALVIGVLQAAAIIPGVSRSGFTLSGALSRKLNRDFAARFSFLLSIPAIVGALVLQIKDLGGGNEAPGIAPLLVGTLSAAVVGFFSVTLMLNIVRERRLWGFAVYTALLGAAVLVAPLLSA